MLHGTYVSLQAAGFNIGALSIDIGTCMPSSCDNGDTVALLNTRKFNIMLTSPCNVYPLIPHFYVVKMGFTGAYIFFLFLL